MIRIPGLGLQDDDVWVKPGRPDVAWVCDSCADRLGGIFPNGHLATYHPDECGVCHEQKPVTEPRDFRWP